jgi:hypothetical protein
MLPIYQVKNMMVDEHDLAPMPKVIMEPQVP